MDEKRLSEIKERCEAATPGPWKIMPPINPKTSEVGDFGIIVNGVGIGEFWRECPAAGETAVLSPAYDNAIFAVAAHSDIPALVAEVERLQKALEWVEYETAPDDLAHTIAERALAGEPYPTSMGGYTKGPNA